MPRDLPVDLDRVPREPGVYLFEDADGDPLYVGKAAELRSRVGDYRRESAPRKRAMLRKVDAVDWILTDSEKEAYILESNLIKEEQPRYNVRLSDDKRYPYICFTDDEYPRILVTRDTSDPDATYFGPFPDAGAAKRTLQVLREVFKLRDCKELVEGGCLNYQMDLCWAPCIPAADAQERRRKAPHEDLAEVDPDAVYGDAVEEALDFLKGDAASVKGTLREEMEEAADDLNFERAARVRDRVEAIDETLKKQAIFSDRREDRDAFALAREADLAVGIVQLQRGGKVVGQEHYFLRDPGADEAELLAEFVRRYYENIPSPPKEVLLEQELPDAGVLQDRLSERRGDKVRLHVPQRGEKRDQMDLARKNAVHKLEQERLQRGEQEGAAELEALADVLDLEAAPEVVEAYDVSHLQGRGVVASRVALVDGQPDKDRYRRYKISLDRNDDVAALREVLERRLHKAAKDEEDPPDLLLVDGGRPQLGAALEAAEAVDLPGLEVAALAKEEELVHRPGRDAPVDVPDHSKALHVLMRARDEAHRFALDYQKRLRREEAQRSVVDEVEGVGPATRKRLLDHFGGKQALQEATVEELEAVDGVGPTLARRIRTHLDATDAAEGRGQRRTS
jgi:excinuclease ABC subunit C